MKPSEQASVVGARFMDILRRAGAPAGTVNFCRGGRGGRGVSGGHPQIDLIAFTGRARWD